MSRTVTLIVHGTFATEAKWWRLGGEGEVSFADRLESELSRRGLSGTVWKPALAEGFDYSSFAWSGRNRHRDRLKGARALRSSLSQLAHRVRATPDDPLTVNFVAHSHGGNVVLEALRHLKSNVRVGRVALLGTPLVTVKPAFRLARFVFSTALLAMFFLGLLLLLSQLGVFVATGHFLDSPAQFGPEGQLVREGVKGGRVVAILFPTLIAYGWLFWLFGNLLDVAWRVVCRLLQPLAWLRGKASALVYGPSPRRLSRTLGGEPVLLLTSYNDEADILLQVGSTPARLYRDYVATDFSKLGRLLELVFLRPFILGVFLKAAGILLEVISLGFSVWRSLLLDYEVAPLDERPYYPPNLLVQEEIAVHARRDSAIANLGGEATRRGIPQNTPQHRGLRLSLQEVIGEIKRQIQLRHSTYYESGPVIRRVAEFLTSGEVEAVREARPSSSLKPSDRFWEALLVGNVVLAVLFTWIVGPEFPPGTGFPSAFVGSTYGLSAYVVPFIGMGINLSYNWAVRRRRPPRPWRWFWVTWAVWGLMILLVALGNR